MNRKKSVVAPYKREKKDKKMDPSKIETYVPMKNLNVIGDDEYFPEAPSSKKVIAVDKLERIKHPSKVQAEQESAELALRQTDLGSEKLNSYMKVALGILVSSLAIWTFKAGGSFLEKILKKLF